MARYFLQRHVKEYDVYLLLIQSANMDNNNTFYSGKANAVTWESARFAYIPSGDAFLVLYNHHTNALCGCFVNYTPSA